MKSHDDNIFSPLERMMETKTLDYFLPIMMPRLMHGHIEHAPNMRSIIVENGQQKEIIVDRERMLYGVDLGPDFSLCFVAQDQKKRFLTRENLTDPAFQKQDLVNTSYQNFMNKYSKSIKLRDTFWEGVKVVNVNGQLDASLYFVKNVWDSIKKQQGFKALHLLMPFHDMVMIWDEIEEGTMNEIVSRVQGMIDKAPPSKRVSNYLYKYSENGFKAVRSVFKSK